MTEQVKTIVEYFGAENLLLTIVPALIINIIIDTFKNTNGIENKLANILVNNGLASLIGLFLAFLYYFVFDIPKIVAFIQGMSATVFAYVFYKIRIYDLLKKLVHRVSKKKEEA